MRRNNIIKMSSNNNNQLLEENENAAIVIEHGPLTLQATQELSTFVYDLPLKREDYDKLLFLMKNHLLVAEREQYVKGFIDGVEVCKAGNLEQINLYPEMNERIADYLLSCTDNAMLLYAGAYIKELERQLVEYRSRENEKI